MTPSVDTALVVRLDSVGDVLLAGPAVRAVAAGARRVLLLCSPSGCAAGELLPGVDQVLVWDCPWISAEPGKVRSDDVQGLVERLTGERISVGVVLTSFHQSPLPTALLLRLAGVDRIGAVSTDYPGSLLDVRLRPGADIAEDLPEARRALAVAEALGFTLPPGDTGSLAVHGFPETPTRSGRIRQVVLHPGVSVPARAWPAQHFAEVATALATAGHEVLVTGGPGERALTAFVAGTRATDLGGRTDLAQLASVLARADVIVAGNTGPAHLAAAVGTPVVSLFAPVVPAVRWAPYRVPHTLLGDQQAPCRDTRARVCPVPGHPCLTGVTVADVVSAVESLLAERDRGERASRLSTSSSTTSAPIPATRDSS
ncbi:MAG TPA: glycosyltransferase family 9 protein [Pseudonocardiaceae bacterium]|jgi:ADP-heptose:LPS heptosyltransferase